MKKQRTILSLCLAVALFCTACGKTGTQLVTDNAEPNSEVTATQKDEESESESDVESDGESTGGSAVFIAEGGVINTFTDSYPSDVFKLAYDKPSYFEESEWNTIAYLRGGKLAITITTAQEKLPDTKLEDVLVLLEPLFMKDMDEGLGFIPYKIAVETTEEVKCKDIDCIRYEGFLEAEVGEEYTAEGVLEVIGEGKVRCMFTAYTFIKDGVPCMFAGIMNGSNSEKYIEEMKHNLPEMVGSVRDEE